MRGLGGKNQQHDLTLQTGKWPEFLRYFWWKMVKFYPISDVGFIQISRERTSPLSHLQNGKWKENHSFACRDGICIQMHRYLSFQEGIHSCLFFPFRLLASWLGTGSKVQLHWFSRWIKGKNCSMTPIAWVPELMFESRGLNHPDLFPQVERHWVSELRKLLPCSSSVFILFVHFVFLFAISEAQGFPAKPCREVSPLMSALRDAARPSFEVLNGIKTFKVGQWGGQAWNKVDNHG